MADQQGTKQDIGWSRRSSVAFWFVAAFTLLVRIAIAVACRRLPFTTDAQDYVVMAGQIAHGVKFVPYWPPGLSLYLSPFVAAGLADVWLRFAMLPFWVLVVIGVRWVSGLVGIQRVAWIILLAFGFMPASLHLSVTPLTQLPVAALVLVSIGSLIAWTKIGGWRYALLAGCSLGLAALVRPSALVLAILILLPAWRRREWVQATAAAFVIVVLLAGWMAKAHAMSGAWVFNTANAKNLWYGNNPDTPMYQTWYFGSHAKEGSEEIKNFPRFENTMRLVSANPPLEQQRMFSQLATAEIRMHPGTFVLRTFNRLRAFWGFDTFTALNVRRVSPGWFLPVLALEAIMYCATVMWILREAALARRAAWTAVEVWLLLGATVLYAAPYWISMSHPTYHFPIVLPLLITGAVVHERFREKDIRWKPVVLVWTCFAILQSEWVLRSLRHP